MQAANYSCGSPIAFSRNTYYVFIGVRMILTHLAFKDEPT